MGENESKQRWAMAFSSGGADYQRLRPSYPPELVEWLVGDGDPVADVGAGTGKLTGVLLGLGHQVLAVEPSADMLAELQQAYPGVPARRGSAEETGLGEDSVGAVVFGQSWHWVDPVAASAECARILRPGGRLGLVWNHLDLTDPRIAALNSAMHHLDPGEHRHDHTASEVRLPLRRAGVSELSRQLPMTTRALAELVTTRSYYLVREAADQDLLREHCSRVVLDEFGTIDDEPIPVPHLSIGHRFRLDG